MIRFCEHCAGPFTGRRSRRFCGAKCREATAYARRLEEGTAPLQATVRPVACLVCFSPLAEVRLGRVRLYCSDACRATARR